ncbi:MAG: putative iron-sulfur binding protein [Burkholderiaceae bacterium]|jgi:predicted pyridoxine 5'-phosphate oxidase superfamily flavin-nucleotide-binding protein|nr:MAG: putative iron-sulfur binding protein [Burkholderiaceae bacterium]
MNAVVAGSPWHEGELEMQARAGVLERMAVLGARVLSDRMSEQHRIFFAQLPFVVAGGLDAARQPWASVLAGPPGSIRSPDEQHLRIDTRASAGDPLAGAMRPGAPVALLGIEPHTRRRNRLNGVVTEFDAQGFAVEVQQSFGNCPKYIQAREPVFAPGVRAAPHVHLANGLDAAARRIVASADTFFVATAHPAAGGALASHGVDVSHRGGRPGFVRVTDGNQLTVPDFVGNGFFNTLGNIAVNPRAGLLFIDFATGDLLHVAVLAEVLWDGPELATFEGAQRLLRMEVVSALRRPAALPLRWGPAQPSPYLGATGVWPQSA